MEMHRIAGQTSRHRRMSAKLLQLHQDVFLDGDPHEGVTLEMAVVLTNDAPRRFSVFEPGLGRAESLSRAGFQQGPHGTAMGVATDDDVVDTKVQYCELDGGRLGAGTDRPDRHEVAHVAHHEEFPGRRLRHQIRIDPAIGAGDEQGLGPLFMGQGLEEILVSGKDLTLEMVDAFHQPLDAHETP